MTQPGQNDPQLKLRLPQSLKTSIEVSAALNNRSMNAEIVSLLEAGGETLRDRFAMAALSGPIGGILPSLYRERRDGDEYNAQSLAAGAYDVADAMMAERSK